MEWLRLAEAAGRRVPWHLLPVLLDFAAGRRRVRHGPRRPARPARALAGRPQPGVVGPPRRRGRAAGRGRGRLGRGVADDVERGGRDGVRPRPAGRSGGCPRAARGAVVDGVGQGAADAVRAARPGPLGGRRAAAGAGARRQGQVRPRGGRRDARPPARQRARRPDGRPAAAAGAGEGDARAPPRGGGARRPRRGGGARRPDRTGQGGRPHAHRLVVPGRARGARSPPGRTSPVAVRPPRSGWCATPTCWAGSPRPSWTAATPSGPWRASTTASPTTGCCGCSPRSDGPGCWPTGWASAPAGATCTDCSTRAPRPWPDDLGRAVLRRIQGEKADRSLGHAVAPLLPVAPGPRAGTRDQRRALPPARGRCPPAPRPDRDPAATTRSARP